MILLALHDITLSKYKRYYLKDICIEYNFKLTKSII